ncbi:MAG: peptidase [Pseudomonadota bacterium]
MTYCVAVKLDAGMVFASDSRSNAGVDQIATVRKMAVFERAGQRVVTLLWAGNLAVTQAVLDLLERWSRAEGDRSLWNVPAMDEAAGLVGEALREVQTRDGPYLMQSNVDSSASFIVGGQIAGEGPRLFQVYAQGNYVEASEDVPYFQIGEHKYGRAIIDRAITRQSSLINAAKCVLVSFDYTLRSNISVGLPIDLLCYARDSLRAGLNRRIAESDPYFQMIHQQWGERLRRAVEDWPDPDWAADPALSAGGAGG